jgi:hypothetical protein
LQGRRTIGKERIKRKEKKLMKTLNAHIRSSSEASARGL